MKDALFWMAAHLHPLSQADAVNVSALLFALSAMASFP